MTERGGGESGNGKAGNRKANYTGINNDEMADMKYHNFVDEGRESDENANPEVDGGNNLHAVNVEPSVEMAGGHSTGRGARRIRGAMLHKSVGCSKASAVCLLLLIMGSMLMIAIVASFARPRCTKPGTSATTTPSTVPTVIPGPWKHVRLPDNFIPWNYTIFLHPNLTTFKVTGHVDIVFKVNSESTESRDFIVFHAADMNVSKPSQITAKDKHFNLSPINVISMEMTNTTELVYLKLANNIPRRYLWVLSLDFDYTLGEGLNGFYRSTYKVGNEERVLATTQMEPTDARRAFPCFDEPSLKATFKMTLIREKRHITLSNMPQIESKPYKGDLLQDDYEESVIMSSYLVAFVVCDFNMLQDVTDSPIPKQVAVYASEDKLEQAQLALDVLKYTIPQYETYFGVKYPLPKQDMIAIPDFAAGAMENWGLITYRQASILHKEGVTSDGSKQWIVQTITHELAHQWFGNYVTMEWWTDLWLNEGFATYVEYLGTSAYAKSKSFGWRMEDQFVIETMQTAMFSDSMSDSHPILVEVESPGEIDEIFDSISYSKGASVIRMLNDYVTESVFKRGLNSYLNMYQYSNAKTEDLWNAIANARKDVGVHNSPHDIANMMDTWTRQMGYPVVMVSRSGSQITATQKHFLLYSKGTASSEFVSPYDYKWTIPLSVVTSTNPKPETLNQNQKKLFMKDQTSVTMDIDRNDQWYKVNYNQYGFYRVNYDTKNWQALLQQLKRDHSVLNPTDKAGIIDDAFNLAWSGQLDYEIPLGISEYLKNENDYIPWASALSSLSAIGVVLRSTEGYPYYQEYMLQLLDGLVTSLGWNNSGSHLQRFLRESVMQRAVLYGHTEATKQAKSLFQNWKENNVSVLANLKSAVYCGGVMYGDRNDWDYVWQQYQASIIPTEKRMLQRALACTFDPTLINKYLYLSIDKDQIRQQDSISVISSVASHAAGSSAAVKFVFDKWDVIIQRYGESSFDLADLIGAVTYSISSEFEYEQVQSFLSKNSKDAKSGQRAIQQALETMAMNLDWLKDNEEKVTEWFKNKVMKNRA